MGDNKKDRPHQPRVQPQNLENGGFQQSYPSESSYNNQPQELTNSVPGYQYRHPSKIANSLEESSAVEGYPPNQHRYADSYYQPQPLQHQSASPLPPRPGSSHQHNSLPPQSVAPRPGSSYQHNAHPPQSYALLSSIHSASVQGYSPFVAPPLESNPSTQRYRSSNNYQAGQPSVPGGTPPVQGPVRYVEANTQGRNRASEEYTTHYNEQRPPVSGTYPPSAPSTDWDDEYESTPVAYPTHDYQHEHAPVALMPVDRHVTTAPTAHPIHTSPLNHEHVQPVPSVYSAPHTQPSQEPMVQPQTSLLPSTQPRIRQSVVSSDPQVPPIVSTLSDATKPPDGYPTVGQHQPSPGPQSSECCCTIF